ncbi:MAG TPA: aldo/keto reductase [Candidatus Polarisedimenticolia bacterium]|nr:aldo/keto reductase [Candidatus Polarisedimenticolia bacterium]
MTTKGSSGDGLLEGRAGEAGTLRYRDRFRGSLDEGHFRHAGGLWLSSIGIGTYLGEPDDKDDAGYRDSVAAAVRAGCNVIDTAINYRFQRSERSVGAALRSLISEGFGRDELLVASKGGFIPFDGEYPARPADWFRSALLEPGIAAPDDVVANCHIMTPRYLEAQIDWSRRNLGLDTIDIYYLHNPETQLQELERSEFLMRVKAAFEMLERKVDSGAVGIYGVATWDGLRLPPDHPGHLSLRELLTVAEQAGGPGHRFRALQLPVNVVMPEAVLAPTQQSPGGRVSLLEAARQAGMTVMASGSLLQGRVIEALPASFAELLPGTKTNAQRGIQLVRSAPGLTTALVGMKTTAHVEENLALARLAPLPPAESARILQACSARR